MPLDAQIVEALICVRVAELRLMAARILAERPHPALRTPDPKPEPE